MSEDEERSAGVPERTADSAQVRPAEESAASFNREPERGSRRPALLLALIAVGWNFARRFVTKPSVLDRIAAAPAAQPTQKKTGRAGDRVEESESTFEKRQKWGTLFVASAFAMGSAAGIGFMFIYWTGGSNLMLGGTLALCLGWFGVALVLTPHWLMIHKQATEPREKLPSSPRQREETLQAFCTGAEDVRRRRMLQWMGATGIGLLAAMVVSMFRSLGGSPADALFTTVWKPGQRLMTVGGKPIKIDSLRPGSYMTVYPEDSLGSEKTQTVLIRVREQLLDLPEERANWAPMGYLAYSRVCTHAGCPVGLYESQTHLLLCPCHQSTFDVLTGATPTGGPAARPLPQLPLYADSDGNLRAAGGFTAPPGPGFWGIPS